MTFQFEQIQPISPVTQCILTFKCVEGQLIGPVMYFLIFDIRQWQRSLFSIIHQTETIRLLQVGILEDDRRQQVDPVWKSQLTLASGLELWRNARDVAIGGFILSARNLRVRR